LRIEQPIIPIGQVAVDVELKVRLGEQRERSGDTQKNTMWALPAMGGPAGHTAGIE
jgi:hypothetical protein